MTGVDTEGHATDVGGAGNHPDRVFVGGSFPIEGFEAMTGREVAGVVFSDPWDHGGKLEIGFPRTKVRTVWRHGAIPMVPGS